MQELKPSDAEIADYRRPTCTKMVSVILRSRRVVGAGRLCKLVSPTEGVSPGSCHRWVEMLGIHPVIVEGDPLGESIGPRAFRDFVARHVLGSMWRHLLKFSDDRLSLCCIFRTVLFASFKRRSGVRATQPRVCEATDSRNSRKKPLPLKTSFKGFFVVIDSLAS